MDPGPYQVRYAWDRRIWTVVCSAAGVTLGGPPMRYRTAAAVVQWPDIVAVEV